MLDVLRCEGKTFAVSVEYPKLPADMPAVTGVQDTLIRHFQPRLIIRLLSIHSNAYISYFLKHLSIWITLLVAISVSCTSIPELLSRKLHILGLLFGQSNSQPRRHHGDSSFGGLCVHLSRATQVGSQKRTTSESETKYLCRSSALPYHPGTPCYLQFCAGVSNHPTRPLGPVHPEACLLRRHFFDVFGR
jgi:hypothetical protein